MVWEDEHHECLLREMFLFEPWQYKHGSKQRGQVWDRISDSLNALQHPKFNVNQKSVRDHYNHLEKEHKKKIRFEERSSGISPEESDFDKSMEDVIERFRSKDEEDKLQADERKGKAGAETAKAEEMRAKAMETFKTGKKRKSDGGEPDKKSKKTSASETMTYLKEKAELAAELKREELQVRKAELEIKKKHEDMLSESLKQQQKQHDQVMLQMQAQNAALLAVIQSLAKQKE